MKPELSALEEWFAKLGELKKVSKMTAGEISDALADLGSKSPHILYGHNIIYVVGNLQFKGSTYYLTNPNISAFLVISDNGIQIFSPSVPDNHNWYEEFVNLCIEFELDLTIIHADEQWPIKSGIAENNMWQITARSQSEAIYDVDLLNKLAGKDFAKLRLVRNKLVDSGMIQFENIETAEPVLELLKNWNTIQGGKYSKNKFEQEAFILKTMIEFKKQYPDAPAYLKYGRLGEKIISYCLFSILPQDPDYGVIHTLKGINRPEAGGVYGASDATYLYVFKYLQEKGVKYINDGELGSEQGTREHKLRFMPVRFNKSYDLLYGERE